MSSGKEQLQLNIKPEGILWNYEPIPDPQLLKVLARLLFKGEKTKEGIKESDHYK